MNTHPDLLKTKLLDLDLADNNHHDGRGLELLNRISRRKEYPILEGNFI